MLPKIITIIFFAVIVCLIYNQLQITKQINNLSNSVKIINKKLSKRKKEKKESKSDNLCNFKQMSKNKCYITSNQEDKLSDSDDIDSNVIEHLELQTSESETSNQIKQINNDLIKTEDIKGQGQISLSLINNDENGKSNTTIPIKLGNVVTAIFNKNINIDLTQSECILNDDDIITNLINKVNVNPITVSHNDPRVEILSDNLTSEDINKLLNSELNNSNDELISNILKHSDDKHIDNHINNNLDEKHSDENNSDNQSDEKHSDEKHSDENHSDENHSDEKHSDENHSDNQSDEKHSDENHSDENHLEDNQIVEIQLEDNQIDNHSDNHLDNHSNENQTSNKIDNQIDNQTGNQTSNQIDNQTSSQTSNQIINKTKNKYNEKDLLKKSLIDIKEIAKELKIQISSNGRPKNKKDLINDILKCNV
jgi:hypothetical protein